MGVGGDIFDDAVVIILVANDVFVIIALPDGCSRLVPNGVDAFRNGGFKPGHQGADGLGLRPHRRGDRRVARAWVIWGWWLGQRIPFGPSVELGYRGGSRFRAGDQPVAPTEGLRQIGLDWGPVVHNKNDPMKMIGHNHVRPQFDFRTNFSLIFPTPRPK